ncbi:MAG: hypothetical protein AAFX10_18300, partial [Pseudomonadota bacterium]
MVEHDGLVARRQKHAIDDAAKATVARDDDAAGDRNVYYTSSEGAISMGGRYEGKETSGAGDPGMI